MRLPKDQKKTWTKKNNEHYRGYQNENNDKLIEHIDHQNEFQNIFVIDYVALKET